MADPIERQVLTIGPGEVGVHEVTMTAGVELEVSIRRWASRIAVMSDGSADLYYSIDGSDPVVAGPRCFRIPADVIGPDLRRVSMSVIGGLDSSGALAGSVVVEDPPVRGRVRLISQGSPVVSVQVER